jgi:hypothetical protein
VIHFHFHASLSSCPCCFPNSFLSRCPWTTSRSTRGSSQLLGFAVRDGRNYSSSQTGESCSSSTTDDICSTWLWRANEHSQTQDRIPGDNLEYTL